MEEIAEAMELTFGEKKPKSGPTKPGKGGGGTNRPVMRSVTPSPTPSIRPLSPANRFPSINGSSAQVSGNAMVSIRLGEGLVGDIINESLTAVAIELERQN
jgi:hypothetical protein